MPWLNILYQLLANPELASEMGKNAREHITANYSMEQSIEGLRKILEGYVISEPKDSNAVLEFASDQSSTLLPKNEGRSHQW